LAVSAADYEGWPFLTRRGLPPSQDPVGSKIEAVEGIVPVRRSLVGQCAAIGLMQQRIADLAISVPLLGAPHNTIKFVEQGLVEALADAIGRDGSQVSAAAHF
jgi:hypothetical protein